jgi:dTDP-4-dehydrorhamnose reductase
MRILIFGSSGMLGSDCRAIMERDYEVVAPDRKTLDIVSWDKVIEAMQQIAPDVVINCAGFTERMAVEQDEFTVRKVNVEGPRNLAQGCARFDSKLIHFSSYCVYSGEKSIPQPYFEDDTVDPISDYGKSKVYSETAVRENAPQYAIVRTGWLYGLQGKNFVKELVARAVKGGKKKQTIRLEEDQFGSPTWTYRLAYQVRELIREDSHGTYHATAEGYCNRLEFAQFVLEKLNIKANLEPIRSRPMKGMKWPMNGILENRLLKKQGIHMMQDWEKDLELFLDRYGVDLVKEAKKRKR